MTYKALCQDCLRAVTFKTERAFDEVSCICGGDLCGCAGCMAVLGELEAGNLSPSGLKCTMESWSAEGGAVGAKERIFQAETYASISRVFAKFGSKGIAELFGSSAQDLRHAIAAAPTPIHEYQKAAIDAIGAQPRKHGEGLSCDIKKPTYGGKTAMIQDIANRLGIKNVYVSKRANEPVETGHLSLTRRKFESVQLGTDIVVTVLQVREDSIAIGFEYAGLRSGSKNLQIDESIAVGTLEGPVLVRLVSISGAQVRLHFEADRSIKIVRTELL